MRRERARGRHQDGIAYRAHIPAVLWTWSNGLGLAARLRGISLAGAAAGGEAQASANPLALHLNDTLPDTNIVPEITNKKGLAHDERNLPYPKMFKIGQTRRRLLGAKDEVTGRPSPDTRCFMPQAPSLLLSARAFVPFPPYAVCSETNSTQQLGQTLLGAALGTRLRKTAGKVGNNINK